MAKKSKTFLPSLNNDAKKRLGEIKSINEQLPYISAIATQNAISTIVDINGNGNFTSIEDAVESGASSIIIKKGTYTIENDITLEGQVLIGESQNNVILNMINTSIILKQTSKTSSGGTVQFENGSRTCNGNSTAFTNLNGNLDNKILFSEGRILSIDEVISGTSMELKTKMFGAVNDVINNSVIQDSFIAFESRSSFSSIENMTINHNATKPRDTIVINGYGNSIKHVHFYNKNRVVTFIKISKTDSELSVKTLVENNYFEGGTISIKMNRSYETIINNNYFASNRNIIIDIKSSAEFITIKNNVLVSADTGIVAETDDIKIIENFFSYINENAIKLNYNFNTTSNIRCLVKDNSFYRCNTVSSYSTNGTLAIRSALNIVSNNSFYECERPMSINCKHSIFIDTQAINNLGDAAMVIFGSNNMIMNFCTNKKTGYIETIFNMSTIANYNIFDGLASSFDEGATLDQLSDGSILANTTVATEELYPGENAIVNKCFFRYGNIINQINTIFSDNDIESDFVYATGTKTITAFNMFRGTNDTSIDIPQDSVGKGNLVEGINPPVVDTSINNIIKDNFF